MQLAELEAALAVVCGELNAAHARLVSIVGEALDSDAWHGWADDAEEYREIRRIIDRSAEGVGRDPAEILRASSLSIAGPWDDVRAAYGWMAAEGIGYLMVEWPVQGEARVREFFESIRPTLEA